MQCTKCQFDNPDGMKFCGGCGAALESRCKSCDAPLPEDFRFCGQCGASVKLSDNITDEKAGRRQLTLMFCDLVGSTSLSEQMDPEDWAEIVYGYQSVTGDVIERYSGHIAQFLGDGILVYFGYPRAHEDDATRAIQAGLDVLRAVEEYSQQVSPQIAKFNARIQVRIGVHTGPVVTGEIGHGERVDQLALGSAPNVAARVQGLAEPGQMLLTYETFVLVSRKVDCVPAGQHKLKGLSRPVTVYRAEGVSDTDVIEAAIEDLTPFVGRDRELQTLLQLQEQSGQGNGQAVFLRGEAGIGKSRLQFELRNRLHHKIDRWYACRCSNLHQNTALYPMLELIKRQLGEHPDREALAAWLVSLGLEEATYTAVLGVLLNMSEAPVGQESGGLSASDNTVALMTNILCRLSDAGPVVISFEDMHWADPTTLEVMARIVRTVSKHRILVIISARPEFRLDVESEDSYTHIDITRFPEGAAAEMIESWIADKLPTKLVKTIVERADGVPLFLEELVRTLIVADKNGDDSSRVVPNTLKDSLMARLDRLGSARSVAQLGALLGRRFDFNLLQRVSQLPVSELEDQLSRVVDGGVILKRGQGPRASYIFKHAMMQDTAYESLLKSQRQRLHNQVVQAIQRNDDLTQQIAPELLARHFEGANRIEEAIAQYQNAGDYAQKTWALAEATGLYRHALKLLATLPASIDRNQTEMGLLKAITEPLRSSTSYWNKELIEIFNRTLELVEALDEEHQFAALGNLWSVHCTQGHEENTDAAVRAIVKVAQRSKDPAQVASAQSIQGLTEFYKGNLQSSIDYLGNCIQLVDPESRFGESPDELHSGLFLCRVVRAWALSYRGHPDTAIQILEKVMKVCESFDAHFALVQTLCHMNVVGQDLEADPQQVLTRARKIMTVAQKYEMPTWVQFAHLHAGWARAVQGDSDGVIELRDTINEYYVGDEVTRGHSLLNLAKALQALDRDAESLEVLDNANEFFSRNMAVFPRAESDRLRGLCAMRVGDVRVARGLFQSSQKLAESQGCRLLQLKSQCDEVQLLEQTANKKTLLGAVNRLYALSQGMDEGRDCAPYQRAADILSGYYQAVKQEPA